MLIHRDYRESSGSIIKIFDDRIEFYNPGGLYGNLTIEDLLSLNYKSQVRNKLIANAFKDIGKIEKYGTGMKRIFSICENYGIVAPRFKNLENGFEVILYKEKVNDTVNDTDNDTDNDIDNRLDNILIEMEKDNKISVTKLAEILNVSRSTILRDIKTLKEKSKITRVGKEKTGYWEIID